MPCVRGTVKRYHQTWLDCRPCVQMPNRRVKIACLTADLPTLALYLQARIADHRFDDVIRVAPPPPERTRKELELDDTKASKVSQGRVCAALLCLIVKLLQAFYSCVGSVDADCRVQPVCHRLGRLCRPGTVPVA